MLDLSAVFADFPVIETERFVLRAPMPEDAADMFHIMGDERVTRYLGRPPMRSLDEAIKRVQMLQNTFQDKTGIPWTIARREHPQAIGTCVFWNMDTSNHRAEIGYLLAPEWWGQGVMTEAARAILTFGFVTMKLHSVEAETDPDNAASRHLLEKLGFVQEGYYREYYYDQVTAQFTDKVVYSLLQANWNSRSNV